MELLLESIRVEMPDYEMPLLPYHLQRIRITQRELWNAENITDLQQQIIKSLLHEIHAAADRKIFKCRLLYNRSGILDIQCLPYEEKHLKSLQLTAADSLQYQYKYADRIGIESLKNNSLADDILMHRDGLITDTSYANVAFFDEKDWITPEIPLLKGVKRAKLLESNKIRAAEISIHHIGNFTKIKIFNAMISADYEYRFDAKSGLLLLQKLPLEV